MMKANALIGVLALAVLLPLAGTGVHTQAKPRARDLGIPSTGRRPR